MGYRPCATVRYKVFVTTVSAVERNVTCGYKLTGYGQSWEIGSYRTRLIVIISDVTREEGVAGNYGARYVRTEKKKSYCW